VHDLAVMKDRKGFTLIETLITTLVLVTGLAAIAGLFSYGAQTTQRNRQRTAASALLSSKMEELRTTRDLHPGQTAEYLVPQPDGGFIPTNNHAAPYLRTWSIEIGTPQRITVIVYAHNRELARATTLVGRGF
jgi:prepilin-type N-terminal cleavage/methylation domain-containing protein